MTVPCVLLCGCSLVTDLSQLTPDAPADGGEAGPPRTFCEQLTTNVGYNWCRDFDDGEPVEFGWDRKAIGTDTSVALDSQESFSSPSSFLARVGPGAMPCADAFAEKVVPGDSQVVHVEFQVRLGGLEEGASFEGTYFTVRLSPNGDSGPCDLVFSATPTSGQLSEESSLEEHDLALRFPLQGVWTKVELEVNRGTGTAQVQVDGQKATVNPVVLPASCSGSGPVAVVPGMWCTSPGASVKEVRVDNIVVNGLGPLL